MRYLFSVAYYLVFVIIKTLMTRMCEALSEKGGFGMANLFQLSLVTFLLMICCCLQGTALSATVLDSTFKPVLATRGTVRGIAPLPAGGQIMVIGDFTSINGVSCKHIARLNADGSVDTSFRLSTEFEAYRIDAVAVQPDGKILIGGQLFYYGFESSRTYLFRLHADGSWDTSFDAGGYVYSTGSSYGLDGTVKAISVEGNGKILVGGEFTVPRSSVARLNADGTEDATFNPGTGADSTVTHIARQANGGIIIGGGFSSINGITKKGIARLGADGALDTAAFGAGLSGGTVQALAVQADDKVLIGGDFGWFNNYETSIPKLIRTTAAGELDATFTQSVPQFEGGSTPAANYFEAITSLLALPDKIIVGGWYSSIIFSGRPLYHDARLYILEAGNGAYVNGTTFNGDHTDVFALARRSDGAAIAGGSFVQLAYETGAYFYGLCRLSGQYYNPDASFKPIVGGQADVRALAHQPDGKIIAGGDIFLANGVTRNGVARINSDGTLDPTLTVPALTGGIVKGLLLRDDGSIVIGGSFYRIAGGGDYDDVALLSPTGSLVSRGSVGGVNALAWYPGNRVLAAMPHSPGVRRLKPDLTVDESFDPGSGISNSQQPDYEMDRVNAVAVQQDGKILVAGSFLSFNGITCQNIVRLNADGSLDGSFASPVFTMFYSRSEIFALALQSDGRILIAGRFSTVNGVAVPTVARLNADGSLDTTFKTPFQDSGSSAYAVSVQGDGTILVGGSIQVLSESTVYNSLIRLNADGSRDTSFSSSTVWTVRAVLTTPAGDVLAGGGVEGVDGFPRFGLARFTASAPQAQLTVTTTGKGSVGLVPGTMTWSGTTGSALFDARAGAVVTLTATAYPGAVFSGWTGGGCSGTGACTVTMGASRSVTATFTQPTYQLTVNATSGSGSGTVNSDPAGIACPGTCSAPFLGNSSVTLMPAAGTTSLFSGWSGCDSVDSVTSFCTVAMTGDRSATATFTMMKDVRVVAAGGTVRGYYDTVTAALPVVASGDTIQMKGSGSVVDQVFFNKPNAVVRLIGGFNSDYTPGTLFSSITGKLTVRQGSVTASRIVIR